MLLLLEEERDKKQLQEQNKQTGSESDFSLIATYTRSYLGALISLSYKHLNIHGLETKCYLSSVWDISGKQNWVWGSKVTPS
mgnify:CR=1 FL=1